MGVESMTTSAGVCEDAGTNKQVMEETDPRLGFWADRVSLFLLTQHEQNTMA